MHRKINLGMAAVLLLAFGLSISAQQIYKIAKIEFEGLNRLSLEEMIATTDLKVGQQFDLAALNAAAQRLVDSGFFKNVAYRTRPNRDQITITFVVEESRVATSRVIFDNFIWFSDTELIAAVRREVPSFSGSAPDNGDTVERITKALQRFLHEHEIEATVSYMSSQDAPASVDQEHVFSVTGIPMPICTLHFPGAKNLSEATLIEHSKSLIGNDYSNKYVSLFSANTLLPLYKETGQLKAAFAPPLPKPEASATCKSGVDLTIPVAEGAIYKWDKAEWWGNNVFTSQELTDRLGMQSGQPVDELKLERASREIQKTYARKGYLLVSIRPVADFNDQAQTVKYKMDVREGPQFRMGSFITKGFPEAVDKRLHERWTLKPGEIFDSEYSQEFSKTQIGEALRSLFLERRAQGKPVPNLNWNRNLNRTSLTVDVILQLTN